MARPRKQPTGCSPGSIADYVKQTLSPAEIPGLVDDLFRSIDWADLPPSEVAITLEATADEWAVRANPFERRQYIWASLKHLTPGECRSLARVLDRHLATHAAAQVEQPPWAAPDPKS